jgi:hypothetical protein
MAEVYSMQQEWYYRASQSGSVCFFGYHSTKAEAVAAIVAKGRKWWMIGDYYHFIETPGIEGQAAYHSEWQQARKEQEAEMIELAKALNLCT